MGIITCPPRAKRNNSHLVNYLDVLKRALPGAIALLVVFAAGCGREDVKVYRVAKEQSPASPRQAMPPGHLEINASKPQLSWTLPAGWKEAGAGQMSLATFDITAKGDKQAQVTVTPLRGLAGKEVLIVNMWRQQAGLVELSAEEVQRQLQPVEIAGEPGKMFEVTGKAEGTNPPLRIVTAMAHRADASWFYKLAGDSGLVEAQKPAFVEFLKSIKITETPAGEAASAPVPVETGSATPSQWKTSADWKAVPPGPMQTAKFALPEKGAAKADVTVSIFPNSTGGILGNVNRWRNQIGLPPIGEAELVKLVTPLDEKIPDAVLVDMTNNNRQFIGAIVPRGGQWFFYKLLGDAEAVAPQKEAFVAFAKAQP